MADVKSVAAGVSYLAMAIDLASQEKWSELSALATQIAGVDAELSRAITLFVKNPEENYDAILQVSIKRGASELGFNVDVKTTTTGDTSSGGGGSTAKTPELAGNILYMGVANPSTGQLQGCTDVGLRHKQVAIVNDFKDADDFMEWAGQDQAGKKWLTDQLMAWTGLGYMGVNNPFCKNIRFPDIPSISVPDHRKAAMAPYYYSVALTYEPRLLGRWVAARKGTEQTVFLVDKNTREPVDVGLRNRDAAFTGILGTGRKPLLWAGETNPIASSVRAAGVEKTAARSFVEWANTHHLPVIEDVLNTWNHAGLISKNSYRRGEHYIQDPTQPSVLLTDINYPLLAWALTFRPDLVNAWKAETGYPMEGSEYIAEYAPQGGTTDAEYVSQGGTTGTKKLSDMTQKAPLIRTSTTVPLTRTSTAASSSSSSSSPVLIGGAAVAGYFVFGPVGALAGAALGYFLSSPSKSQPKDTMGGKGPGTTI